MSSLPPDEFRAMRANTAPTAMTLVERWSELHAQAGELDELAAISHKSFDPIHSRFAKRLATASGRQRRLAGQGIEDIDAMMRPGLTALRIIAARDQDATAPALALWREFHAARDAVLAIVAEQPAREAADAA